MSDDFAKPFLTIRYVVEDDTFAVVDTARGGEVVRGGFKTSGGTQRFAEELYACGRLRLSTCAGMLADKFGVGWMVFVAD